MKHIASVSFGKDSLAMLLLLIEKNYPLDEVVFYDTGMEFQAIYNLRDKVKPKLTEKGIKYIELKPKNAFEYDMYERRVKKRSGIIQNGYQWCGGVTRWGTDKKIKAINKYCGDAIQYVGIAADERNRMFINGNKYPLVDACMTERDCLKYCYKKGYNWNEDGIELYDILSRVSCYCCGNKNLKELKNIYMYLPEYWQKLRILQGKIPRPFRGDKTIFDLEDGFKKEADQLLIQFKEAK